jgi:chromosome segregation ATPase
LEQNNSPQTNTAQLNKYRRRIKQLQEHVKELEVTNRQVAETSGQLEVMVGMLEENIRLRDLTDPPPPLPLAVSGEDRVAALEEELRTAQSVLSREQAAAVQANELSDAAYTEYEGIVNVLQDTVAALERELEEKGAALVEKDRMLKQQLADLEDNRMVSDLKAKKLAQGGESEKARADRLQKELAQAHKAAESQLAEGRKRVLELEEESRFKQERVKHYREKVKALEDQIKASVFETSAEANERLRKVQDLQREVKDLQYELNEEKRGRQKSIKKMEEEVEERHILAAQRTAQAARELQVCLLL